MLVYCFSSFHGILKLNWASYAADSVFLAALVFSGLSFGISISIFLLLDINML